jgi:hypothetical protein
MGRPRKEQQVEAKEYAEDFVSTAEEVAVEIVEEEGILNSRIANEVKLSPLQKLRQEAKSKIQLPRVSVL